MAANPEIILRGTEDLVREQNSEAYCQSANLLSEFREAFKDSDQAGLAEEHAQKLKAVHPYKVALHQALRKSGFLQRKKRNNG